MLSASVHAAIEAVYGAALDPDSWPLALDRMAKAIDCEAALILSNNFAIIVIRRTGKDTALATYDNDDDDHATAELVRR